MMTANTIDHATLEHLVEAGAVRGTSIIGQPGGWGVVVQYGMTERALAAKRGAVRIFRKFETLVGYLKDVGIVQYQVDASQYDPAALQVERARSDASQRLKDAHEAVAYRDWLEGKVGAAKAGLEDGSNQVITAQEWASVRATKQKQRAAAAAA